MRLLPIAVLLTLVMSAFGQTYTITTVAGSGTEGFSGDNGPATNADLNGPFGVAVDSAGNLYIADEGNGRIRKVSNGVITTVAGNGTAGFSGDGGPATSAELFQAYGVAVNSAGSLYIADAFNNRIRKVSNGVITTAAGNGTRGFSGDNGTATSAELTEPIGVAVDSAGNLYIADTLNQCIRKVTNGAITTVAGSNLEGEGYSNGPATSAQLNWPYGVAVDSVGNLYIADSRNGRIRKVSNGVITTVAGGGSSLGDDGPATSASLGPTGVAVDVAGNLYIADEGNNRIRKVSNGVITTVAGGGSSLGDNGPATSAYLNGPFGVAVDSAGNVYVADTGNSRIRLLTPTPPTISTLVNAASFSNAPVVSPGEIVSIGGTALGPANAATLTLDSSGKVSTSIGGVTVTFNGFPAPLIYVSASQINAVVPYEVAGFTSPFVQVKYLGQSSNAYPLRAVVSMPAIFTANSGGTGQGAILNQDGSYNSQTAAPRGSSIVVYMTGDGQTTPSGVDGQVTTVNTSGLDPLTPTPLLLVYALIGGVPALVQFAGEAPGLVSGVLQVNIQIPASAPTGNVPISISIGNNSTQQGVTVSVQ